jgi:hypothetical protein
MKKNMGSTDRLVRLIAAAVLSILYFMGVLSGTIGAIALVVAALFLLTSFVSFCPAYLPFGISTFKTKEEG